jgi:peptide deformylase
VNGENIMEENESKIMDLVDSTDPILTSWAEDFDFDNPPADPVQLALDLVATMRYYQGIGIAGPQVGFPYRVFAMEGEPARVCFNPRIVSTSGDDILLEEGCLSYPGLIVKVKRPQHARIRFTGPNGETFTEQFTGMTARVIQHECDHLEGILFFDKANRYHREQAFKNWKKWKKVGILNNG